MSGRFAAHGCDTRDVRTEVRNQVTMLGNPVAAEVSSDQDPHRTWLWLGPVGSSVELRRVQQPRGVDPEEWSDPDHDPKIVERETFPDLDAALGQLRDRGVDTEAFDALWKTPNPF